MTASKRIVVSTLLVLSMLGAWILNVEALDKQLPGEGHGGDVHAGEGAKAAPLAVESSVGESGSLGLGSSEDLLRESAGAVVWAVNVGGVGYSGIDGVVYEGDSSIARDVGGKVGEIERVLGSQDSTIYKTFRVGRVQLSKVLGNGVYDVSFKFAEPEETIDEARIFDVIVEGEVAVDNIDVQHARDGKALSALSRTVTDVVVSDGVLDIVFDGVQGEALINALVVRKKFPLPGGRELVWGDEFDYQGLPDSAKWNVDVWDARHVNDEDQAYTGRSKNLRVEGGMLILEAFKEDYRGAEYTSARIHSQGKGDLLYGRIDVRAKLPSGQGTWPAIWMLPSDPFKYATLCEQGTRWQGNDGCDAWPNSGEIDIMEHVGFDMNTVHGTVHNKAYYWRNWEQRKGSVLVDGSSDEFHTYSLEWTPSKLFFFVDDTHYFTYENEQAGWQAWPYDHPFHLILNLAVGGMWGRAGGDIDDSIFPQRMEVDYVRLYGPLGQ